MEVPEPDFQNPPEGFSPRYHYSSPSNQPLPFDQFDYWDSLPDNLFQQIAPGIVRRDRKAMGYEYGTPRPSPFRDVPMEPELTYEMLLKLLQGRYPEGK